MSSNNILTSSVLVALLALVCLMPAFAQISMNGWNVNATKDLVIFESPLGIKGSSTGSVTNFELPESTLIKVRPVDGELLFLSEPSIKIKATPINGSVGGQQFIGGEISTNPDNDTGILLREGGIFFCDLWGGLMNKIESPENIPFSIQLVNGSIIENITSVSFL